MKKFSATIMLLAVLALSEPVLAADLGGFYVAPKFFWSQQNQDSARTETDYSGSPATSYKVGNKSDDAWGGALALGYNFGPKFAVPIRTELEYALRSQTKVKTRAVDGYIFDNTRKMNVSSLFANVFYDINTGTKFTPYVGGGIGIASIRVKDKFVEGYYGYSSASSRKTVTNFAWNVGAGVAYSFDSNWALDLGYRYCDFGTVKGSTATDDSGYVYKAKSEVTAHEVLLGLRYSF